MENIEQQKLIEHLNQLGINDLYMANQLTGLISELAKGFKTEFSFYPDMGYINEKIRNIKTRIEDFQK